MLSVALASLLSVSVPSNAGNGGAVVAGVLGGLAAGAVIGAAAANHPPPPPPQTRVKYVAVPVYVQAPRHVPRHCWMEKRETYDGADYVAKNVKVCP